MAMFISGRVTGLVEPRLLIALGLIGLLVSGTEMASWNPEVGVGPILWTGFLQGLGAGIMLVPIQVIAFRTLPAVQRTEATAVFNLVRSVGSSVGVSMALTLFVHVGSTSRAHLVEHVTPYSQVTQAIPAKSVWSPLSRHGLAGLDREIEKQALVIGYTGVFRVLAVGAALGLPMLLLLGRRDKSDPASASIAEPAIAE
jgi:DHA2 family multidrug resistance protein